MRRRISKRKDIEQAERGEVNLSTEAEQAPSSRLQESSESMWVHSREEDPSEKEVGKWSVKSKKKESDEKENQKDSGGSTKERSHDFKSNDVRIDL